MVRWAPIKTPFERRRQTAAVLIWLLVTPVTVLSFFFLFLHSNLTVYCLAYLIFVVIDTSPDMGSRKIMFVRRWRLWKWLRDYFPMKLIKTADLDPKQNYLFGYHPHGIIGLGAFTNFGTEANEFSSVFPGIDLRVLTLQTNFNMPFFREILLSLGFGSVSRKSCDNILNMGPGNSCMIVVGGAAEALYAFPGTYDLVLKKRYGFIKVALRNGSNLVPVLSFGENDIWDQVPNPKGSLLRKIQQGFQRYATFSPPLFHGRGIFQYDVGILPHRRAIVSVVGKPIPCPRIGNPSEEQVLKYQKLYFDGLQELFDTYKDRFAPDRKSDLTIAE